MRKRKRETLTNAEGVSPREDKSEGAAPVGLSLVLVVPDPSQGQRSSQFKLRNHVQVRFGRRFPPYPLTPLVRVNHILIR